MSFPLFKKVALLTTCAAFGSTLVFVPTYAATDYTNLTLQVNAGQLSITSPESVALDSVTIDTVDTFSNASILGVNVVDTTGSLAGWNVNAKFGNLRGLTDNTKFILLADEASNDFSNAYTLGDPTVDAVKAHTYFKVDATYVSTITGNDNGLTGHADQAFLSSLSALDQTGESNAFPVASASSGNGNGEFEISVYIGFAIPPYGQYNRSAASNHVSAQSYRGTATFTII